MELNKQEIIEFILSGDHKKAVERLSRTSNHVIDENGNTLYHYAILSHNIKALRWLLRRYQKYLPPVQHNSAGQTCFHLACESNQPVYLDALCDDVNIPMLSWCKIVDNTGLTPLHTACLGSGLPADNISHSLSILAGNQQAARKIVSQLKNKIVHDVDQNGQTALHAAAAGGNISCVRLLCYYNRLINVKDKFGAPALHYALLGGYREIAQHLIERCKANIPYQTIRKMNAFHAAVVSGDLQTVQYMFNKVNVPMKIAVNNDGSNVLHMAAGLGYLPILANFLGRSYFRDLVNFANNEGHTPAHLAAYRNWPKCLSLLIKYYSNIHLADQSGTTVYGIMCNNETNEMRTEFSSLFEELDLLRRRSDGYSKVPKKVRPSRKGESKEDLYAKVTPKHLRQPEPSTSSAVFSVPNDRTGSDYDDSWLKNDKPSLSGTLEIIYV